jgi:ribosome-associated heat shock protein Hsp15
MTKSTPLAASERLDKWLWFARVLKTRTLASSMVEAGRIRVNGSKTVKPSHTIKVGDVLTISVHHRIRVLEVQGFSERRGPAEAASQLYRELTERPALPNPESEARMVAGQAKRLPGAGRPTKKDRRAIDRLKGRAFDLD